jgi:septal ring factor EnvC (AmiA/AmiB activator)
MAGFGTRPGGRIRGQAERRPLPAAALALAAWLAAAPPEAHSQSTPPDSAEVKRQLESRRRSTEEAISSEQAEIANRNKRLVEVAGTIQDREGKLTVIESRLMTLETQERSVRDTLAARHGQIAALLAAMQRLGRNPPPVIITRRQDALEMVRSAMLVARAFPGLRAQAEELAGELNNLVRVLTEVRAERDKHQAETAKLTDERRQIASLLEEKRQSLAERHKELEDIRRQSNEIARTVTDLNQVLRRLDQEVAQRTGLGAYEEQQKELAQAPPVAPQATPRPPAAAPAPPGQPEPETRTAAISPPPRSAVQLEPRAGPISANPGRIAPSIAFPQAKGMLPLPAQGKRALSFGERTSNGRISQGVVMETRPGAQITSPCDGWIVFAGPFRSYGQILIINPGNGYHMLIAGLSQIDVQLGQFVLAAEPVGTMATGRPAQSSETGQVLYIELRKDGRPIDPDPWWMSNAKTEIARKVQE